MIRLSIIVPVYNVEAYIATCLDSILSYSGSEIEVIAVVDGSKDGSEKILREYGKKDTRLRIITQENQGVSAARNKGMEAANGEYLTFVDADDWLDTRALQNILAYLNQDVRQEELIFTAYTEVLANNNRDKTFVLPETPDVQQLYELAITGAQMNYCWGKIYRTDIIKKHRLAFRRDVKIGEDIIFVLDYLEYVTKAKYLSDKLYYYRQNNASVMQTVNTNRFYEMEHSYKRRQEFCDTYKLSELEVQMKLYYRRTIYYYLKLIQQQLKGLKEKCKMLREVVQIPFIRQLLLSEELPCQTQWQKRLQRAVKANAGFLIWYFMRQVSSQDIANS